MLDQGDAGMSASHPTPTRMRILILVVVLLALLGGGVFLIIESLSSPGSPAAGPPDVSGPASTTPGPSRSGPPGSGSPVDGAVVWAAGGLPAGTAAELRRAAAASTSIPGLAGPGRYITIVDAQVAGNMAVLTGRLSTAADRSVVPTEPVTLLGSRSGGTWTVLSTGDRAFCATLARLPGALGGPDAQGYFRGCPA